MMRRMMSGSCSPSYPPVFRRFAALSVMILSEPWRVALPAADR
jgi:hypothetical protein